MSVAELMKSIPDYSDCYKNGLGAVENINKKFFRFNKPRKIEGSIYLDKCSVNIRKYQIDNRWDYMIGYDDFVYFIEIHPAYTNEVRTVLRKLDWLKIFISELSDELKLKLNRQKGCLFWVATNGVHILPNSPQARALALSGIRGPISIFKV